jgi:hypothetical protein
MAIFIHFYILLGFLDLVADIAIVSYSWIYTHKWYSDVLNLFWDVFKYLPITTQVFILIRLYLLFYNLSLDNCDYTLHTSPKSYDEFFNSHKWLSDTSSSNSSSSTGGNPQPRRSIWLDIVVQQNNGPSIDHIMTKIRLQDQHCLNQQFTFTERPSIYSREYSAAAILSLPEQNLLADKISSDILPSKYGVVDKTIDHTVVRRVVVNPTMNFNARCSDVKPSVSFLEFLGKYS